MKRFFSPLALVVFLLAPFAAHGQNLGQQVGDPYPFAPSKVLSDPIRDQVYATVPVDNTVRVISTTNLDQTAIIQLPTGSIPVDMAISQDRNTLYVANSGSTDFAVSVINLTDLTLAPTSIALPGPGQGIAVARDSTTGDDLLFVLTTETLIDDSKSPPKVTVTTPVLVVDAVTGQAPANGVAQIGEDNVTHKFVGTSPDGASVLVTGSLGLEQFNVSDGMRAHADPNLGTTAVQLTVSNTGKYICVPDPAGNGGGSSPLTTLLFNSEDVAEYYGTLNDPATPGPLTFTAIDDLVYQIRFGTSGPEIVVFYIDDSTDPLHNFLEKESFALPTNGLSLTSGGRNTLALDRTGSLLFVGASTSFASNSDGELVVVSTGVGDLNPFQPPVITTTVLPDGAVGQPYSAQVMATHVPTSYGAVGLPNGLTIDAGTGVISGTPTTGGGFSVILTAANSYGSATATASLTISGTAVPAPVITSPVTASDPGEGPFTYRITATNNPTSFGATGLPANLTINTTTGLISGTPVAAGTFTIILSASNGGGTGTATLTLTVTQPASPVITSPTTATVEVGMAFTYQITARNNPTSFGAVGLPAGFTIDATTGLISGIPGTVGTFSISLRAANAGGTAAATLTVTVTAIPTPVITSPTASTGTVGTTFSYQITASNMPISYTAVGLPSGLSVNTTTGLISGTPLVAGSFSVTLTATNVNSTGMSVLTLAIASNVPTVEIMATVPRVTAGTGDHAAVTISRTGDLSQPLIVAYAVKGSARNGTDYYTLSGKQKIKPNRASATVQIIPKGTASDATLGVKIILLPAVTYDIGTAAKAKVKIVP